ncbi:MAG: DUF3387 domain-containing protein, partial [Actinomycetota bacterium]|nr:DUF3387 domain-containing protein [Actinomycetota bacterium]
LPDGKKRFMQAVTELSQAFALAVPADEAIAMRDDVGFFQALRSGLAKGDGPEGGRSEEEIELAIRQLVSKAVAPCEVVDIFAAAGLDRPDISILSDEFLEEVRHLPQRNLAVETLRRLLQGEIRTRSRKNVVQARSFEAMLQESIRRYQNRAIEAAQVIEELIQLAKEMREAQARGDELGLNDDEVAFYDALAMNESAVRELGDEVLAQIAQELVERVRQSATIDWKVRQSARSQMKVMIKRLLRKYKYPPDQQEAAVKLVIEQAEVLSEGWAA